MLGANKSGAPWPAVVPSDETFPRLQPWKAGGGLALPSYVELMKPWHTYSNWCLSHPTNPIARVGPPYNGTELALQPVQAPEVENILAAPSAQANVVYEQWWAATASNGKVALPLYAWARKALRGELEAEPASLLEVPVADLPDLAAFVIAKSQPCRAPW